MTVRILTLLVVLVGGLVTASCTLMPINLTRGSGTLVTKSFDIADFDSVSASHAFALAITQGDSYSVQVTIDDNFADMLIVEKDGSTLKLSLEPGGYTNVTQRAEITMPMLGGLRLSGASSAALAGFSGGMDFTGHASGASTITGDISAAKTVLDISGASRVTLRGESDELDAKASGASKLNLGELAVRSATLDLSGASSALVNASEEINASASGSSKVVYLGSPARVQENTSGASSVRQQ